MSSSDGDAASQAAARSASTKEEMEDKLLQEEYRVWKKNSPFLYDLVMTHALEWPSLSVQWLDEVNRPTDRDISIHKLILGTHTSNAEPNYLMIAEVCLPEAEIDARKYDDERGEVGGFGGTLSKIEVKIKINHEGEVHRARAMPQNNFMIATKSPNATVLVFDYSKHDSKPRDTVCRPQFRCHGHTSEGYGIAWSPVQKGRLLSGSNDAMICVWDVTAESAASAPASTSYHMGSSASSSSYSVEGGVDLQPMHILKGHTAVVGDVDWHKKHAHLCGSVSDDSQVLLWDLRENTNRGSSDEQKEGSLPPGTSGGVQHAHGDTDVNCLSFNPYNEFLLATGGSDNAVCVWDLRQMRSCLHSLEKHTDAVYQVAWNPSDETILGSCSSDRRVHIWDLTKIGQEQSAEDALDGPPELIFIHGGHTGNVSDFAWNQNDDYVIASVAEDNILQIWQMAENMYADEEGEGEEELDDAELEGAAAGAGAHPQDESAKKKRKI